MRPSLQTKNSLSTKPPIDFSFKRITCVEDLTGLKPRETRVGNVPKTSSKNKYLTAAIWLNNNLLASSKVVSAIAFHLLEFPAQLSWIDVSFNNIDDINEGLLKFVNLKILYLHGNSIRNISEVKKLKSLTYLTRLTLHGNPIDSIPQYRSIVIHLIPHLVTFDFAPVVTSERTSVAPVGLKEIINENSTKGKNVQNTRLKLEV